MDINKILYDWVSFSSSIHSKEEIIKMLGLDNVTWQNIKGAFGYRRRLYFDMISIHYDGNENMGVWCEMSGQGCRAYESFGSNNYEQLFSEISYNKYDMNITRLDIAYDDFEGLLDLDLIIKEVQSQNYLSPFREWQIILGSKGNSVQLGSMKSDIFIRIYDKAMERNYKDGRHWVRLEIQMRDKLAQNFAFNDMELCKKFVGVLNNYLRFVEPNERESNKCRWKTAAWWQEFINSALRIKIYEKPGVEYNELNLERYVFKQAGNSIDTFIKCFGTEKFFEKLENRKTALNPRQEMLIQKYKK